MNWTFSTALALGGGLLVASSAPAALIIFDDALQNGAKFWADNGSTSRATTTGERVDSGTTAVYLSKGNWSQAGLSGLPARPVDSPILRLRYYREGDGSFVLRLSDANTTTVYLSATNQAHWTIDGVNGSTNNTPNAWHTLRIDVPAMNLSAAVGRIGVGNSSGSDTWYFDDVAWVAVPEPGSLSALGLAGGTLLFRRRRA